MGKSVDKGMPGGADKKAEQNPRQAGPSQGSVLPHAVQALTQKLRTQQKQARQRATMPEKKGQQAQRQAVKEEPFKAVTAMGDTARNRIRQIGSYAANPQSSRVPKASKERHQGRRNGNMSEGEGHAVGGSWN